METTQEIPSFSGTRANFLAHFETHFDEDMHPQSNDPNRTTLESIEEKKLRVTRRICRIVDQQRGPIGTGFMIAPGLILSNQHVLKNAQKCQQMVAEFFDRKQRLRFPFDGKLFIPGSLEESRKRKVDSQDENSFVQVDPQESLDYALASIDGAVMQYAHFFAVPVTLPYGKEAIEKGKPAYVVGYPEGAEERVYSDRENTICSIEEMTFSYTSETKRGSSGSPVFDRDWDLIGLHWGGKENAPYQQEGIRYDALKTALLAKKEEIDTYLTSIGATGALNHWWDRWTEPLPFHTLSCDVRKGFKVPVSSERLVHLRAPLHGFIERVEYLTYLRKQLIPEDWQPHTPIRKCVLYGLGGVGKTELACYFANEALTHYSLVFWLNSETDTTLYESYTDLAKEINVYIDQRDTLEVICKHVHSCLEQFEKPWLLIYDNVEKTLPLPQRGGFILITAQDRNLWKEEAYPIEPFSFKEAMELLGKAAPKSSPQERQELAKKLDCFPLALGQAAGYLSEEGTSIPDYLQELTSHLKEEGTERHPKPLMATWGVTLQKLKKDYPIALAWLRACAYLDPSNIPESLLTSWLSLQSTANDNCHTLQIQQTGGMLSRDLLRILKRHNLISWKAADGHMSLHRQMQSLLRADEQKIEKRLEGAIEALKSYCNDRNDLTEGPERNFTLLSQLMAVLTHVKKIEVPSLDMRKKQIMLFHLAGNVAYNSGAYEEASSLFGQAAEQSKKLWGEESIEYANSLNSLGKAYTDSGEYDTAIAVLDTSLKIRRKKLKDKHLDIARCLNNLGRAYYERRDFLEALNHHQEALDIKKYCLEQNNPEATISLNNIGRVYFSQGHYDKAIEYFNEGLEVLKKSMDSDSPSAAFQLNNLGSSYFELGNKEKAEFYYKEAIDIRAKTLGKNHPNYAFSINKLGDVYREDGQLNKAFSYHNEALKIRENVLRRGHHHIALSNNSLGDDYFAKGDYPNAIKYYEQGLKILDEIQENHPDAAHSHCGLGDCYYMDKKHITTAINHYKEAVTLKIQAVGEQHPHVARYLNKLGMAQKKAREWLDAQASLEKAYAIAKNHPSMGPNHPKTLQYRENLQQV